jgi:hypothetical protein
MTFDPTKTVANAQPFPGYLNAVCYAIRSTSSPLVPVAVDVALFGSQNGSSWIPIPDPSDRIYFGARIICHNGSIASFTTGSTPRYTPKPSALTTQPAGSGSPQGGLDDPEADAQALRGGACVCHGEVDADFRDTARNKQAPGNVPVLLWTRGLSERGEPPARGSAPEHGKRTGSESRPLIGSASGSDCCLVARVTRHRGPTAVGRRSFTSVTGVATRASRSADRVRRGWQRRWGRRWRRGR